MDEKSRCNFTKQSYESTMSLNYYSSLFLNYYRKSNANLINKIPIRKQIQSATTQGAWKVVPRGLGLASVKVADDGYQLTDKTSQCVTYSVKWLFV